MGTCRIDELEPAALRFVIGVGADAMRADDDPALRQVVQMVDRSDALGFEPLHHLRIVDDGAERTGAAIRRSIFPGDLDGALDAITEPQVVCQKDFQTIYHLCDFMPERLDFLNRSSNLSASISFSRQNV